MATLTITDYLKYAQLQMAAEAFLVNADGTVKADIPTALLAGNGHASRFPNQQAAEDFAAQWTVVDQEANTGSGFSGTLFRANKDDLANGIKKDDLVISFRSTEFLDDAVRDNLATNTNEIKNTGWAWGQIADMEAWYAKLNAEGGPLEGKSYSVTGYSLGGHLATAFNLLRREDLTQNRVTEVVTFNGAGVGKVKNDGKLSDAINQFVSLRDHPAEIESYFTHPLLLGFYKTLRANLQDKTWTIAQAEQEFVDYCVRKNIHQFSPQADRIYTVIRELREMSDEANRLATLKAGGSGPDAALSPLTVSLDEIQAYDVDYRMAVFMASQRTENAGNIAGAQQAIRGKKYLYPKLRNQYDVVADTTPSMVSNSQWHYGTDVKVFIEDQPEYRGTVPLKAIAASWDFKSPKLLVNAYAENDFGDTHSLVLLVDSLSLMQAFKALDAKLELGDMSKLFKAASASKVDSALGTQGKSDGDALETMLDALYELVVGKESSLRKGQEGVNITDGNTWANEKLRTPFFDRLQALLKESKYQSLLGNATIQTLINQSQDTLLKLSSNYAENGYAYRYALKEGNPFAILGADYGQHNQNGELDLYDKDSNPDGQLTEQYLKDRSAYVTWLTRANTKNTTTLSGVAEGYRGADDWVFTDQRKNQSITVLGTRPAKHWVVFGDEKDNADMAGGSQADFLYGGKGQDKLDGGAGNDYLEGNIGNDTLTGGQGSDHLLGGLGDDVYKFTSGDGWDWIEDQDGLGHIEYDGITLGSTEIIKKEANVWHQKVGAVTFTYSLYNKTENGQTSTYLSISGPNGGMWIKNWAPGKLGLTLPATPPPAPRAAAAPETSRDILGDLALLDTDPGSPGVQPDYDDLHNYLTLAMPAIGSADLLNDSTGNDRILSGAGNDDINATHGGDNVVELGAGDDHARLGAGKDHVFGEGGIDIINGGSGADLLVGGDDADILIGGDDQDFLYGDQQLTIEAALALNATQESTEQRGEFLMGEAGADHLVGSAGADYLAGGGEDDLVIGGGGDDLLQGDASLSYVYGDWSFTREVLEDGQSTQYQRHYSRFDAVGGDDLGGKDTLYGGSGSDWIFGQAGDDLLDGGRDNDVLFGGDGRDTLIGGADDDVLNGGAGSETGSGDGSDFLDGGQGHDRLWGDGGDDIVIGGEGNDTLRGDNGQLAAQYQGDDYLDGGEGNDALQGNNGHDTLIGGDGHDLLEGDADDGVEVVYGNDYLDGGEGDDILAGAGGNDTLLGGKGADQLFGDADSTPEAGHGDDLLDGGEGNDYLRGYGGNDILLGGLGNDQLAGDAGDDVLDAGDGDDALEGGDANDLLAGGAGEDDIVGDAGADTLIGGAGADALQGGTGNDLFVVAAGDSPGAGNAAGQRETLYEDGGVDTLRFDGVAANGFKVQAVNGGKDLLIEFGGADQLVIVGGVGGAIERFEIEGETLTTSALIGRYAEDALRAETADGQALVSGGFGNDLLLEWSTRALLSGGRGNDTLESSGGHTTYAYEQGDGQDIIIDTSGADGEAPNRLLFGTGITPEQLRLRGAGDALTVTLDDAGTDEIRIEGFGLERSDIDAVIHQFEFASGLVLDREGLLSLGIDITGSDEGEHLSGAAGQDQLLGLAGDDHLYGLAGDDVLDAGTGDDWVEGGEGQDTYVFNRGDGVDTLVDAGGVDTLQFGEGIAPEDLSISHYQADDGGYYLFLNLGDGDRIGIRDGALGAIEQVVFADGQTLAWRDLVALLPSLEIEGSAEADLMVGTAGNDRLDGLDGDDRIEAGGGDDTLIGDVGNDTLLGGAGRDIYTWGYGVGDDTIIEADGGENLLVFEGGLVAAPQLALARDGDDLLIGTRHAQQTVRLTGYYSGQDQWRFRFGEGAELGMTELLSQMNADEGSVQALWNEYKVQVAGDFSAWQRAQGRAALPNGSFQRTHLYTNGYEKEVYSFSFNPGETTNSLSYSYELNVSSTSVLEYGISPGQPQASPFDGAKFIRLEDWATSKYMNGLAAVQPNKSMVFVNGPTGDVIGAYVWPLEPETPPPMVYERTVSYRQLTNIYQLNLPEFVDESGMEYGGVVIDYSLSLGGDALPPPVTGAVVNSGTGHDYVVAQTHGESMLAQRGALLYGNDGNDYIAGGDADDLMIGGRGADTLAGGHGGDTYYLVEDDAGDMVVDTGDDSGRFSDWFYNQSGVTGADRDFRENHGGRWVLFWGVPGEEIIWEAVYYSAETLEGLQEGWHDEAGGWDVINYADWWAAPQSLHGPSVYTTYVLPLPQVPDVAPNDYVAMEQYYGTGALRDDRLVFGTGVTPDNLVVMGSDTPPDNGGANGELWLYTPTGQTTRVNLPNADSAFGSGIEFFEFANGAVLNLRQMVDRMRADHDVVGTAVAERFVFDLGNDRVFAGGGDDEIQGGAGDDSLSGNDGDDYLRGEQGNDILLGGQGADGLIGGAGNDVLRGGEGSDGFSYQLGDGSDEIHLAGNALGDVDTLALEGISPDIVHLSRDGDALVVSFEGTDDVIRVVDYWQSGMQDQFVLAFYDGVGGIIEWDKEAIAGQFANIIIGTDLAETLTGTAGQDVIRALAGNDKLNGVAGDDTLEGGEGNDTLNGGIGDDLMAGGVGNDLYYVDSASDVVVEAADEGTDRVIATVSYTLGEHVENLTLSGAENLSGTGNALNNTIAGNTGNNWLQGLGGNDNLSGNTGNDTLEGGEGNDTLNGSTGDDWMMGGAGNDTYYADSTSDVIVEAADEGTDRVIAAISHTLGEHVENLTLSGAENLSGTGNALNNTLAGNTGNNWLQGLGGNDNLSGGTGNDTLEGGEGNDTLNGGIGDDLMAGNVGNDTYYVDSASDLVVETADEGTDRVIATVSYTLGEHLENLTLSGSENLSGIGNALNNTIAGNTGNNWLQGLGGNDNLSGNTGNDTLEGGEGNDTLNGSTGDDWMMGGAGNDTYYADSTSDVIVEAADEGTDRVIATISQTLGEHVENLTLSGAEHINGIGNSLNNALTGNTGNNLLQGFEGNDTLNGGAGDDILEGGEGNDTLTDNNGAVALLNGGAGADKLVGGIGNEFFIGGTGNDTLTTGAGNDLIAFNKNDGQDTFAAGGTGSDTLSLGGGVSYADLSFSKSSNDLVLKMGGSDQITFKNWYAATPSKPLVTLQMVAEAIAGFDAGGADPLLDDKIETFSFADLVADFDAARLANPMLTQWELTNTLTARHLSGSDDAAIGGDLAYQYGKTGSLSEIGVISAQGILSSPGFGSSAQALQPLANLQDGVRLS